MIILDIQIPELVTSNNEADWTNTVEQIFIRVICLYICAIYRFIYNNHFIFYFIGHQSIVYDDIG